MSDQSNGKPVVTILSGGWHHLKDWEERPIYVDGEYCGNHIDSLPDTLKKIGDRLGFTVRVADAGPDEDYRNPSLHLREATGA